MNFEEKLAFGKIAEKEIENMLIEKGNHVIRSYDYQGTDEENKAPRMFSKFDNLVLPDLDVSSNGSRIWIECKHYTAAPFNRKFQIFVHGIKIRHYKHYLKVEEITGNPVYLYIKEIENNCFLTAKLKELKTYPCLLHHEHSEACLIYFNRKNFDQQKIK